MSAQDRTEKVLKNLHILLSKSPSYEGDSSKVVVDKQKMIDLLNELNSCIYGIMEEHEVTKEGRNQAEREFRKHGEEIISDATKRAEDIYAASFMYTDEALGNIQDIMQKANDSVKAIYEEMSQKLQEEKRIVRNNQSELKAQLHDFKDTEKYLHLIEERNREILREKDEKEGKTKVKTKKESSIYANRQTEIKINPEYFEKAGIPLEEQPVQQEEPKKQEPEIKVNLDAEYFQWKNSDDTQTKEGKKAESKDQTNGIQKVWKMFTSDKK